MTAQAAAALPYDGRAIVDLAGERVSLDVGGHHAEFVHWGFYEPYPWRNYLHTHSYFEVCYAYSGRGVFRSGDEHHVVEAGALFVARPGDVHEIVSSHDDPLGIQFWSYTLVPEPPRRPGAGPPDGGRDLLQAFADPAAPVVSAAAPRVPVLLELLTREASRPGPGFGDVVSALAGTLVVDTARAVLNDHARLPAHDVAPGGRNRLAVKTMVRYLHDNYDRPVSVRDVVAQVHLSERHANRLFRRVIGTTIHAYLTRLRLDVAAQRLVEHGLPIKEIAHTCGYPDVRHFTTAFHRQWGAAPGAFRARNGTTQLARR
ncbi:MAG: helix-turn-helix domain-containing protein [Micromonosporaceae bacterium]|nr:helix-turn-helix domain-containing protein [Micromonosporaceae bacterium]